MQEVIDSRHRTKGNDKKRLSAKCRQAQKNYRIYSHDFCIHIHTQNTPTAGTNFF